MTTPHDISSVRTRVQKALAEDAFVTNAEQQLVSPSGRPQSWLFDYRSILLRPILDDIAELYWSELEKLYPCQVGGLETAAIGLIGALVVKAKQHGTELNGFYVRKSRKKDGLQRMIEGSLNELPIVLIDDGLNSGKSFMRQIKLLELEGRKVKAVCVMLRFRDESFYRYFTESGIKVISFFTLDDFPKTGGVAAYMKAKGHAASEPREHFSVQWKFASADPSHHLVIPKSAPALDEERVYVGADNGTMWALNQNDGSIAWSHKTLFGAGKKRIFSSPLVHNGIVYFGAYDGNLYALDAKTGKKIWIYREADWIGSSPTIAEDLDTLFIGLEFGLWNKQGGLAALDPKTGEKKWWQPIETLVHSSPGYSRKARTVIVGSSAGRIYAFDATSGKPKWTFECGGAVRAGFAFDEKRGYVCFGSEDHNVYILDARTGKEIRRIETYEAIYSNPLVEGDSLYIGLLDKRVLCIDLANGQVKWIYWTNGRIFAAPLLAEGKLYIGSNDGRFYELDPATGAERGYFQATERIVNRAAYNPATKRFFVPTHANELYCLVRS